MVRTARLACVGHGEAAIAGMCSVCAATPTDLRLSVKQYTSAALL